MNDLTLTIPGSAESEKTCEVTGSVTSGTLITGATKKPCTGSCDEKVPLIDTDCVLYDK